MRLGLQSDIIAPSCLSRVVSCTCFPMRPERANIQVSVAETIEAEVMSAVNRAGGLITDVRRESEHSTGIGATVPRQNLAAFEIWLRDFSNGQGRVSKDLP